MANLFGKPSSLLANTQGTTSHVAGPPRFADFSFQTIGKGPELLKRISAPNPDQGYYQESDRFSLSPSSPPNLEDQLLPSDRSPDDEDVRPQPRTRPSLLESLTGNADIEMLNPTKSDSHDTVGIRQATTASSNPDQDRVMATSTRPLAERIFGTRIQNANIMDAPRKPSPGAPPPASSAFSGPTPSLPEPPPLAPKALVDSEESATRVSSLPSQSAPLSPAPSEDIPDLNPSLPPGVIDADTNLSYTTLRALQARLLSSLSAFSLPDTDHAIQLAQSANNQSATVLSSAHRTHAFAQQALDLAQESIQAARQCLDSAEGAKKQCEAAMYAIENNKEEIISKKREWEEAFKSEIDALGEWVRQKEVHDSVARRRQAGQSGREKLRLVVANQRSSSQSLQSQPLGSVPSTNTPHSEGLIISPTAEFEADAATRAWNEQREQADERRRIAEEELRKRRKAEAKAEEEQRRAEAEAKAREVDATKRRHERIEAEKAEAMLRKQESEEILRRERELEERMQALAKLQSEQKKVNEAEEKRVQEKAAVDAHQREVQSAAERKQKHLELQQVKRTNQQQGETEHQQKLPAEQGQEVHKTQDLMPQEFRLETPLAMNGMTTKIQGEHEKGEDKTSSHSPQSTLLGTPSKERAASVETLGFQNANEAPHQGRKEADFLKQSSAAPLTSHQLQACVIPGCAPFSGSTDFILAPVPPAPTTGISELETTSDKSSPPISSLNLNSRASSSDSERSIPLSQQRLHPLSRSGDPSSSAFTSGPPRRGPYSGEPLFLSSSSSFHSPPRKFSLPPINYMFKRPSTPLSPSNTRADVLDNYISVQRESRHPGNIPFVSHTHAASSLEAHHANLMHVSTATIQVPLGHGGGTHVEHVELEAVPIDLDSTSEASSEQPCEIAYTNRHVPSLPLSSPVQPSLVEREASLKPPLPVRQNPKKLPDFKKVTNTEIATGSGSQLTALIPLEQGGPPATQMAQEQSPVASSVYPQITSKPMNDDNGWNRNIQRSGCELEGRPRRDSWRSDVTPDMHSNAARYDPRRRADSYRPPPSRSYDHYSPPPPSPRHDSLALEGRYPQSRQWPAMPTQPRAMTQRLRSRSRSQDAFPLPYFTASAPIIGKKRSRDDGPTSLPPSKYRFEESNSQRDYHQRHVPYDYGSHNIEQDWSRVAVHGRTPSPVAQPPQRGARTPPRRLVSLEHTSLRNRSPEPSAFQQGTLPDAHLALASRITGRRETGDFESNHPTNQLTNPIYQGNIVSTSLPPRPGLPHDSEKPFRPMGSHAKPYGKLKTGSSIAASPPDLLARFSDSANFALPMQAPHRPTRPRGNRGRGASSQRLEQRISSKQNLPLMDRIES